MKLGIDLDGVVVDFVGACADILGYYKAEDVQMWDDAISMTGFTPSEFFGVVRSLDVFWQALPVSGAVAAVEGLRRAGHDIHFITHRPEWAEGTTKDWIRHYFGKPCGIQELHVLSNGESKSSVSCDLYLDDAPHVLTDLMDNHRRVVRFERPWNKHSKDWDFSVANWEEFATLVEDIKNRKATPQERWHMPGPFVHPTMAMPVGGVPVVVEMSGTASVSNDVETKLALTEEVRITDPAELARLTEQTQRLTAEVRLTDPITGGEKGTKPQRMDLLPWDALAEVSSHYGAGAEKYTTYGECTCRMPEGWNEATTKSGSEPTTPSTPNDSESTPGSGRRLTESERTALIESVRNPRVGLGLPASTGFRPSSMPPSWPFHVDSAVHQDPVTQTTTTSKDTSGVPSATAATSSVDSSRSAGKKQPSQHSPGCEALAIKRTGDRNWERGYAWHLSFAALQRHLAKWWQGEELDEEGLHHLNAVVFHALSLRTFSLRGIGTDDRPVSALGGTDDRPGR